jgi:hypothetical protein
MENKRSLKIFIAVFSIFGLFAAKQALAICPICTIAVGAGVGVSRWMGIDDAITGLWVGGLVVSLIGWTINWLNKRNIRFKFYEIITILGYFLLTVVPLYYSGIIGNPNNNLLCWCGFYLDKLLLGIIVGSSAFYLANSWYEYIREKNNGRAYFPFQKIAMPVSLLLILSLIFYLLLQR